MELIALILFIVFMFATANDKKKKKGKAPAGTQAANRAAAQMAKAAAQATNRAAAQAGRTPAPVGRMSLAEREDRLRELREKKAARERAVRLANGVRPGADVRPEVAVAASLDELKARLDLAGQGISLTDGAGCVGGSMAHDHAEGRSAFEDEDCFGGSMEHTHTEGVSRAGHARRMAAIDAERDADVLPEVIDASALRRAVVMAEVLGRPRALQARRRAGMS